MYRIVLLQVPGTNEAVRDPTVADPHLRRTIDHRIPLAALRRAAAESDRIVRPLDNGYVDFFETRNGYLRQCPRPSSRPSPSTPFSTRLPCWRP